MNNFITANDFKVDIQLPINTPQVVDSLNNDYIPKYQKEILVKLLGYTLYLDFETGLSDPSPDQKWLNLRDGCTYQDVDDSNELQYVQFLGCKEIVKYYVYYKFLNDLQNKVTPTGAIKQNNENSNVVPATFKLYEAWNKMIELYGRAYGVYSYYFKSSDFTTSYSKCDVLNPKLQGNAYNFIYRQNEISGDTYDNWNFTELTKMYLFTY